MPKIFISHTFTKDDQELGSRFAGYLSEKKMKGYLAEKEQEYVLLIGEKIKHEIRTSDCLVAIITSEGLKSASVHEEIGFAMGRNIPVILMVKETLKGGGVLIHGKELEYFNETNFESRSQKIIKYIQDNIRKKKSDMDESVKEFLLKRNLLDSEANNFCKNSQTELLEGTIQKSLLPNGTPFVLFSSYPCKFTDIKVHGDEIDEFLKKFHHINIQDHPIRFLEGEKEIEMDSIVYRHRSRDRAVRKYLEFQKNGFVEQGFSYELIYKAGNPVYQPILNNCWLTGAFWAFVKFCKLYYEGIKNVEEFDIIFSVRNCRDLKLLAYRENKKKGDFPSHNFVVPETERSNIRLLISSLEPDQMTDKIIASKAHEISNSVAHAYGLQNSTCYDHDNIYDWNRMDDFSSSL